MRRQQLSLSRDERRGRIEHNVAGASVQDTPRKGGRLPKAPLATGALDDDRSILDLP
jgi:hypothetical protein